MKKPLKILIIRLSSMGDIVVTTPIIRCLKIQKQAEIHFLVKKQFHSVVAQNIYIDRCKIFEGSMPDTLRDLKKENYDLIIDLHKNLRSLRIRSALRKRGYSYDKLSLRKWLWTQFGMNTMPKKHLVDRYFEGLHPIGLKNDGKGLDFFISKEDKVSMRTLVKNRVGQKGYYALVLGAAHHTKRIPPSIAEAIIQRTDDKCVLIGGPMEKEIGMKLANTFPQKIVNTCGECSIPESAALLSMSRLVISGDTGMMHIAAAIKKKTIVIWGSTHYDFGMYPYYGDYNVESYNARVPLDCNPCTKIGNSKCPKKHFHCMMKQDVDKICITLRELFNN